MPKVGELYRAAVQRGKPLGVRSQDIRVLLARLQGYPEQIDILLRQNDEVKSHEEFERGFERLAKDEPVEYVINEAEFLGHKLYVDQRVLIPRLETEELVSKISQEFPRYFDARNYLVGADIGTGSGAIAIALKSLFPHLLISASDISKGALEVAKKNFASNGVHVTTLEGDALSPYIEANMALDLIVSNPPYILNQDEVQPSVKNYEPAEALYLDKAHSVYEKIFRDYKKVKRGSLLMCFEIGYDLKDYLTDLMATYLENYEYEFINDLDGLLRFLFIYLS